MVHTSAPPDRRPPPALTMELDNVTAAVTAAADDLPLHRLLATVLLPAAAATDGAYRRLDAALRADTGRPPAAGAATDVGGGGGGGGSAAAAAAAAAPPGGAPAYDVTCAHVTEDLKVAAEVLAALALALTARPRGDAAAAAAAAPWTAVEAGGSPMAAPPATTAASDKRPKQPWPRLRRGGGGEERQLGWRVPGTAEATAALPPPPAALNRPLYAAAAAGRCTQSDCRRARARGRVSGRGEAR